MGAFDRGLRAFVVTPAAIVVALIVGAGTVVGIVLIVVAAIMLTTAGTGFCPNYTCSGSPPTPGCIASAIASAAATPSRPI
jgi:hypothetical protein